MSASVSVCVFCVGVLAICIELLRPGKFIFGAAGVLLCFWAAWDIWNHHPEPLGVLLCAIAAAAYIAAIYGRSSLLLALAAGALLVLGSAQLWSPVHPVAVGAAIVLGIVTTVLTQSAARARRNKRVDLNQL